MSSPRKFLSRAASAVLRGLILFYRYTFSYFLGRECRFMPTCSAYALEAIDTHGPARGAGLALRRFCRCHPWGGHGVDPVPGTRD